MKFVFLIVLALVQTASASCDNLSPQEFWSKVKAVHPDLIASKARLEIADGQIVGANVRPNPQLNLSADTGEALEGDVQSIEAGFLIPIELGGKRSARMDAAQKYKAVAASDFDIHQSDTLIKTYVEIHNLRQMFELETLQKEALKSMQRYQENLNKRKSLSPEQEVELGTIELALSDMSLKLADTANKRLEISRHLGFFAGLDCAIQIGSLPKSLKLEKLIIESDVSGGEVKSAKARLDQSLAQMELEKANAARNINIGPIFRYEKQNIDETYAVGLALSFEMPFFDRNQGERTKAANEVVASRITFENTQKEARFDLETWYTRYHRLIASLEESSKASMLQEKRKKVERFFERGVISASLVIETYRQLIEFTQSRNSFELSAIYARAQILKLTGKIDQLNL
ncbi:MAG: TolC family protein [bacterium]